MTRRANARVAGVFFLVYIAVGITSLNLSNLAAGHGEGAGALANIAQHATLMRISALLDLSTFFYAVILGVTLYALTRDQDRDLAAFAMCCRVGEGVVGAVGAAQILNLVAAATSATADNGAAAVLQSGGQYGNVGSTLFAVGSTVFAYLFLRARSIPVALAWLGVIASGILVVAVPLQMAGFLGAPLTALKWIPALVYELVLAGWLLVKGVAPPS